MSSNAARRLWTVSARPLPRSLTANRRLLKAELQRQGFGGAMASPNPCFFMRALLHIFFYLLYHPFAAAYDLVASTVSLGRWKDWILSVIPFLEGNQILEIGHGPGHLQRVLLSWGFV